MDLFVPFSCICALLAGWAVVGFSRHNSAIFSKSSSAAFAGMTTGLLGICDAPAADNPNRFSLRGHFAYNVSVDFRDIDSLTAPGPAAGGGLPRTYQDGFIGVDVSGNAGGLTWFWGYENASQVDLANDRIFMNAGTVATPGTDLDQKDGPQQGFDVSYGRVLGESEYGSWGLRLGVGWTDVGISGMTTRLTDAFALGGVIPPDPPFSGTFVGPGPLISDAPTRGTTASMNLLEGDLYGWRMGPFVEAPVGNRLSLSLDAGLAFAYFSGRLSFNELTTAGGIATGRSLRSAEGDFLFGAYTEAQVNFRINDDLTAIAGVGYQFLQNSKHSFEGRQATLDLGKTVLMTFGIAWSF